MRNRSEKGFSAVESLMLILIVALIGIIGWLVYNNQQKSSNNNKAAQNQSTAANQSNTTKTKASTQPTKTLAITQLGIQIPISSSIADLSYSWDAHQNDAWIGSSTLGQESISPSSTCGITSTPQTFNQSLSPDPADPNPIELNDIILGTVSKITGNGLRAHWTSTISINGVSYGFIVFPTNCSSTPTFNTDLQNYITNFESSFSQATTIQ